MLAEIRGRIALVVIDTLARAMVGNENAPEDMGAFVAACGQIREATETNVLIVHHCGKDMAKGARGQSGLRAATDVELEITGNCIRVSKNRDQPEGQLYGFRLEQVELGHNAKGRRITTCVAIDADPPAGAGKKRKLGTNERLVFDALAARSPTSPTAGRQPPTSRRSSVPRSAMARHRHAPPAAERGQEQGRGLQSGDLVSRCRRARGYLATSHGSRERRRHGCHP